MSGHTVSSLLVREAIDRSFAPPVEALDALRIADASDPVTVHHARTSVRRLRSNIRALDGHVEPVPTLRGELGWIAEGLGGVWGGGWGGGGGRGGAGRRAGGRRGCVAPRAPPRRPAPPPIQAVLADER